MVGLVAAISWQDLTVPAAFLLGAGLATVATLRIVRHVVTFFTGVERRRRFRRDDDEAP